MIRRAKPESPPSIESEETMLIKRDDFVKLIARIVELEVSIQVREALLREINQMQESHLS
jgi:hypothetical protein